MIKQNLPDDEICYSIKETEAWSKEGWIPYLFEPWYSSHKEKTSPPKKHFQGSKL